MTEWIFAVLDRWATDWIRWRQRQEPDRYYITMQSDDTLFIRDVRGRTEAVLKRDGTFVLCNYELGLKTTLKTDPCQKN